MSMIYADVLAYVSTICTHYIGKNVENIATAISPTAYGLLGIYIMLWGLVIMRGLVHEPIMDATMRIVKIACIFSLAIKLANYNIYITHVFFNTPEQLAQSLTHSTNIATSINNLDAIVDKGFSIGTKFWSQGGIIHGDFGMYIIGAVIYAMTIAVTAYACFLIIMAKIAMTLLISFGPIFIISLLFQSTANLFNAWIKQLSNYFLLMLLVVAANVFIIDLFAHVADLLTAKTFADIPTIDKLFPFLITGFVSLLVLGQLPSIAASLAGGASLSSYGIERMGLSVMTRPARDAASFSYEKSKELSGRAVKFAARKAWQYTGSKAIAAYKKSKK